jgi:hypothetical protein
MHCRSRAGQQSHDAATNAPTWLCAARGLRHPRAEQHPLRGADACHCHAQVQHAGDGEGVKRGLKPSHGRRQHLHQDSRAEMCRLQKDGLHMNSFDCLIAVQGSCQSPSSDGSFQGGLQQPRQPGITQVKSRPGAQPGVLTCVPVRSCSSAAPASTCSTTLVSSVKGVSLVAACACSCGAGTVEEL